MDTHVGLRSEGFGGCSTRLVFGGTGRMFVSTHSSRTRASCACSDHTKGPFAHMSWYPPSTRRDDAYSECDQHILALIEDNDVKVARVGDNVGRWWRGRDARLDTGLGLNTMTVTCQLHTQEVSEDSTYKLTKLVKSRPDSYGSASPFSLNHFRAKDVYQHARGMYQRNAAAYWGSR